MATTTQWQPPRIPSEEAVTVLAVGEAGHDRQQLRRIFASSNWRLIEAVSCSEAHAALRQEPLGVVLCDCLLADGCWKQVLEDLAALNRPPLLVVASRNADDALWSEVLNLGGYDVLAQPYETKEVVRVLSHAWLHWKSGRALAAACC